MIDKSFLILRANPSLSGNVKLVVSSNYQLYLESYNANQTLMKEQFKHFLIKNNEYWKEVIPAFFTNVDNTSIFDVRNINDVSQSYTDYSLMIHIFVEHNSQKIIIIMKNLNIAHHFI